MDVTIAFGVSALLSAGFTADVGPGFQVSGDLRGGEWVSLGLELRGLLPGRVVASEVIDPAKPSRPVELDVSQLGAQLVPCFRVAKIFLFTCAVAQGSMLVTDDGFEVGYFPSFALGPRLGAELPFDRFAVFAWGEALIPMTAVTVPYAVDSGAGAGAGTGASAGSANVRWTSADVSGFFGAGFLVKFE